MVTKRIVLMFSLLALPALSETVSAQIRIDAKIGRHIRVGADFPIHRHPLSSGHYQIVQERVFVPGQMRQICTPARYGWVYDSCGRRRHVMLEPARTQWIQEPGHYEWQERRVWVPNRGRC